MTIRIGVWSGPRNISTALMRAWENRPDCTVVDEPFYADYLVRTGLDHPGRDEVIAAQPTRAQDVIDQLTAPIPEPVLYVKHMTHHLADDADLSWTVGWHNVLLIRDPAEVVASYVRSRETCEPDDIGLQQQQRIADELVTAGRLAPVIDAGDFLRQPEGYLRWLCAWAGLDFTPAMLSWPAGPRESDGVWAPYWYADVQRSTGFQPWRPREIHLSEHDAAVAAACRPAYDDLHALRVVL